MLKCLPAGAIVFGVSERENPVTGMAPFPSENKSAGYWAYLTDLKSYVCKLHMTGPKSLCMQWLAKLYKTYCTIFLFCLPLLSLERFLFHVPTCCVLSGRKAEVSHRTEAVDIFVDSGGKDQGRIHISNQTAFISYNPYPVKILWGLPGPWWGGARSNTAEISERYIIAYITSASNRSSKVQSNLLPVTRKLKSDHLGHPLKFKLPLFESLAIRVEWEAVESTKNLKSRPYLCTRSRIANGLSKSFSHPLW